MNKSSEKHIARQVEALEKSIAKWVKIVDGTGYDDGANNCKCCEYWYYPSIIKDRCEGCPIFEYTGRNTCQGTPYDAWRTSAKLLSGEGRKAITLESIKIANEEVEFLKKVLRELT